VRWQGGSSHCLTQERERAFRARLAAILFLLSITGKFQALGEFGATSCRQEQFRVTPVGRSSSKEINNGDDRKRDRLKRVGAS